VIGGWSPFTNYLSQEAPRMLVGFDPTVQVLHLEDAAAGFVMAALATFCGPVNLAANDTVVLSQAIKLAGRQPMAVLEPLVELALAMGNKGVLGSWPYDTAFLRHSCVADTRRAREVLGWEPIYSTVDALALVQANGSTAPSREHSEEVLRAFLSRRSQP
jgi:UDP-glucose 4-epimerase